MYLAAAETDAERALALRDYPRRLATEKNFYDVPLCRACANAERKAMKAEYYEREFPAEVAAFRAAKQAAEPSD